MPEYGLGAMQPPQDALTMQFRQAAQNDPGQASQMFRSLLMQQGIDPNAPLAKTLTQYVSTGGMDAGEAMRRLGGGG